LGHFLYTKEIYGFESFIAISTFLKSVLKLENINIKKLEIIIGKIVFQKNVILSLKSDKKLYLK
jgi:hypothetical protein